MSDGRFIAAAEMVKAVGPVTQRELDTLRSQREKPAPVLELTIGGTTEQVIHKLEQERRTVRESYIENRLQRVDGRASNDFARASLRGRAKHDFDRSR